MANIRQHLDRPVDASADHVRGELAAALTLVEYGDFECPSCIQAYGEVRQVESHFGGRLRLVFRHFPLSEWHPSAFDAARAAEAAGSQGKFWLMHDRLFEAQGDLSAMALRDYAVEVGLDVARFDRELAGDAYSDQVTADRESAERSGARGTPAFFIGDALYEGPFDADSLTAAIDG
jgi:protein-disulfide isomerase